jgi:hypothetical protein
MKVDILRAVERLNNKVSFLQPLYEAIVNSLEAKATKIEISLDTNPLLINDNFEIKGFIITDNGEGFTEENREAFITLWTPIKKSIGGKGIGRLTWLKVFNNVKVESLTEKEKIIINFSCNFDHQKDVIIENIENNNQTKTKITFCNLRDEYKNDQNIFTLEKLKNEIEINLKPKLFFLKQNNKEFYIRIVKAGTYLEITNKDVENFNEKRFLLQDFTKKEHLFILYYIFIEDKKNKKYLYYCAHRRIVKKFIGSIFNFDLPDKSSVIMLLESEYFDNRINDERNEFTFSISENNPDLQNPIPFTEINKKLKYEVDSLIIERYPGLKAINEDIINNCIDEYPHLTKYIIENDDIIKEENGVINKAKEKYNKFKENTAEKFKKLLIKQNLNDYIISEFDETIKDLEDVSAIELAEYILYRDKIISTLNKLSTDKEKQEKKLHDLFMIRGTDNKDTLAAYNSNIWLIDDKYMSYVYMASDKTIKQICKVIRDNQKKDKDDIYKSNNRPDLVIFSLSKENDEENKSLVVIEFKAIGASQDEKNKAFTEINNNIDIIKKNISNISEIYSYIITSIDEDFKNTIKNQDYNEIIGNGIYYKYLKNLNGHSYILSVEAILKIASKRNNVFLNFIKKKLK